MTGKSYTCHNCPRGRGPHCVRCRRVDFDDIRIQHQPHNRAELQAAQTKPPSTPVTSLPPAVENRLREFIFDLFDLDPLQLHLLSHVRNGGTPNTFGRTFVAFLKSSIMYGQRKYRARWNRTVDEIGANITRATALSSIFVILMGIVAIALGIFAIDQPIYIAIVIGIVLIIEGISLLIRD